MTHDYGYDLFMTTYGGGLRVSEVIKLQACHIDSQRGMIRVVNSKRGKDRYTLLSARLLADGARVRAYDPVAEPEARKLLAGVEFADSSLDALAGADAAVIVTDWPEFGDLDWARAAEVMQGKLVIDGRNMLDPRTLRDAGLVYEGIGRR